jgi:hypothetical protein
MRNAYEDAMPERLIGAWHDAVNNRDLAAARAAVTDPVEVSGPHGTHTITAGAFADWILTSGIRLVPLSAYRVDDLTMVVEQEATWPGNADPEAAATPPTTVATLFRVRDGALGAIHRFGSVHDALRAARDGAERGAVPPDEPRGGGHPAPGETAQ